MERTQTTEAPASDRGHDATRVHTPRTRIVLPPSHGNVSLLPLPLPESSWPTDATHRGTVSAFPRPAMFAARATVRVVVVAAVLALTFVG